MPYKIFIVEDHPVMCQAYADLLSRETDLELCGTATSAEEGLTKLEELSCDLVVADVSLPGIDGIQFVSQLLKTQPDMPVLIISGHDEAVLGERARRAGARSYLSKRKLAATLVGAIRLQLDNESRNRNKHFTHQ